MDKDYYRKEIFQCFICDRELEEKDALFCFFGDMFCPFRIILCRNCENLPDRDKKIDEGMKTKSDRITQHLIRADVLEKITHKTKRGK
jgi:hypothetical protein